MLGENRIKNIIWNTGGSIFYALCQWLITVIVVRISSYENAGYLSLAMTTSSTFSSIALFGMRNFQVSDVAGEYSVHEYVGSRILTCSMALISCSAVTFCVNTLFQAICINAFMLIRIAEAIVDVMHAINQKYERYDYIGKSFVMRGLVTAVGVSSVLFLGGNLAVALYLTAILNLGIAICYDCRNTRTLSQYVPVILRKRVFDLLRKSILIVIFNFALSLMNLLPKMALEQMHGASELGIYTSIAAPTLIVQVAAAAIFSPFLQYFSTIYYSGEIRRFSKQLHKLYAILGAAGVISIIGANLIGRWMLRILFGEYLLQYYYLFIPIILCTVLTAYVWIISTVLILMREIKLLLLGVLINLGITVLLMNQMVAQYGKNGVSVIQIVTLALYTVYMIVVCEVIPHCKKNRES